MNSVHINLANRIAEQFKIIDSVEAIAFGGSNTSRTIDEHSDIDLYIYSKDIISLDYRQAIVEKLGASKADLNLSFWDIGDEWFDLKTGIEVDIIYWDPTWIEEQLKKIVIFHQGRVGYSTCFWHTITKSKILFDRLGWFAKLQEKYNLPYPERLQMSVIAKNHPVLRSVIPSYYTQIKKALWRQDLISVNHRIAALLASYFDVLFAINKVKNPGEKKVMEFVLENCPLLPKDFRQNVLNILQSSSSADKILLSHLDTLLDGLDNLLAAEGIDPAKTILLT